MKAIVAAVLFAMQAVAHAQAVTAWISSEDLSHKLSEVSVGRFAAGDASGDVIAIDPSTRYQSILGIGASLEHATCYNLTQLDPAKRAAVIESLVNSETGIGMNLMRICIGTSDFTSDPWFSYNDMPPGETDLNLEHFTIEKDRAYVLPILKAVRAENPELLFFASPWSPPGWMKSRGVMTGGRMKPEYYGVYARYLLKFVEAYEGEGIPIHALTLQNEPDYAPNTYPTCHWRGEEQAEFIRDHAGPLFREHRPGVALWCWDHNFNLLEFPRAVLSDPAAAQYVNGTAFHHYEGKPSDMSVLHEEFPQKDIYFTEGSTFGARGAGRVIDFFRNWARSYNAWVTMIDANGKPNNGPHDCSPTSIVYHPDDGSVEYRFDYYMYGQFSKFIQRNAVRIASTDALSNAAFANPDGSIAVVVTNPDGKDKQFSIQCNDNVIAAKLPAKSVGTYLWRDNEKE